MHLSRTIYANLASRADSSADARRIREILSSMQRVLDSVGGRARFVVMRSTPTWSDVTIEQAADVLRLEPEPSRVILCADAEEFPETSVTLTIRNNRLEAVISGVNEEIITRLSDDFVNEELLGPLDTGH